jgi:hypothetical protein
MRTGPRERMIGIDQKDGEVGEECGGDIVGGAMARYCGLEGLRVGHDDVPPQRLRNSTK